MRACSSLAAVAAMDSAGSTSVSTWRAMMLRPPCGRRLATLSMVQSARVEPPTLAPAFHPDVELLDEPDRALVQRTRRQASAPRGLHQRRGTRSGDPALGRSLERRPETVRLEGDGNRHHREGPARPSRPDPPDQSNDGPLARAAQPPTPPGRREPHLLARLPRSGGHCLAAEVLVACQRGSV